MKRRISILLSILLVLTMLLSVVAGCDKNDEEPEQTKAPESEHNNTDTSKEPENSDTEDPQTKGPEPFKVGVLVADVSGEEALGFRNYYENYVAKQYDIEFLYSEQLTDAAEERSAIEKFAAQGVKAIISLSSSDRAMQIETCAQYDVYYAVASGMLDEDRFEQFKGNEYFVGQIGPSMETEYEAGYNMGKFFADKGVGKVALYGAFIPNPMHVYRAAGVLSGLGLTYGGTDEKDAVVGQIFGDQGINLEKVAGDNVELVAYFQGFGDTTTDELNAVIQSEPEAFISVGMATTFFTQQLNTAGIDFSDIDSFTSSNREAMEDGHLVYLAGKYSSSIGPVIAAVINAVEGHPVRDGNDAVSISQNYKVATDIETYDKYFVADQGDSPIYDKATLDELIGESVTYEEFKGKVESID